MKTLEVMKEKNKFIGWSLLDEAKKRRCLQRPCSCGRSLIFEAPKAKPDDLITEGEYPWWINPVLRGKDSEIWKMNSIKNE